MNLDYLHEFTELAKHLNFTETARLLNMSQPTLSKHISQFERELKLTLFERVGNTLRLTKSGAILLPYAYQIIDAQTDFNERAQELRKRPPAQLTISGLTDEGPSTEVLGFLIALLSDTYGADCLEVKSRFNRDPNEMLHRGEVDIVFDPAPIEENLEDHEIEALHIADLQLCAILSRDNPLAESDELSLDDLRSTPFLKYEGVYIARSWSYIDRACRNHGFIPKTRSCHCASIAELFSLCANLGPMALIVGANFGSRLPSGIQNFCRALPLSDEDASVPLYFLYLGDNPNPVLHDALARICELPRPPLRFVEG